MVTGQFLLAFQTKLSQEQQQGDYAAEWLVKTFGVQQQMLRGVSKVLKVIFPAQVVTKLNTTYSADLKNFKLKLLPQPLR